MIGIATCDVNENSWFDEFIRIPDFLAGSYASFDLKNNSFLKSKFNEIVTTTADKCINILLYYDKTNDVYSAARLGVTKK